MVDSKSAGLAVLATAGVAASAFAAWKVNNYFKWKLKEKETLRYVSEPAHAQSAAVLLLRLHSSRATYQTMP